MLALPGRTADRLGHDRVRDLIETLPDASQPEVAERRREAVDERRVAKQSDVIDGCARLRNSSARLASGTFTRFSDTCCSRRSMARFASRRADFEMRRTIRDDPDPPQRVPHLRVAIRGGSRQRGAAGRWATSWSA